MKILLVDDSKDTRYTLRIGLKRLGVEVETADSGEAAIELLETHAADAILMDHIMPGMNGLEALEIIRDDPRTAHLPIVLFTSRDDPPFARKAIDKGVLSVLSKPVSEERLAHTIEQLQAAILAPGSHGVQDASTDTGVLRAIPESPPDPAAEGAEDPAIEGAVPDPADVRAFVDQEALIDTLRQQISTGLESRLTGAVEALRLDLVEMIRTETHHALELQFDEERRSRASQPAAASVVDLAALEQRLTEDRWAALADERIAAAMREAKADLREEVAKKVWGTVDGTMKAFITEVRAEFSERMAGELVGFKDELAGFKGELAGFKGERAGLEDDLVGFKGERAGLTDELAGLTDELAGLKDERAGLRGDLAGLRGELAGLKGELAGLKGELAGLKGELALLGSKLSQEVAKTPIPHRDAAFDGGAQAPGHMAGAWFSDDSLLGRWVKRLGARPALVRLRRRLAETRAGWRSPPES